MRPTILLLALLLTGCENPLGLDLPDDAEPMTPISDARVWWAQIEAETGIDGDFDSITWYYVPSGPFEMEGQTVSGVWVKKGNRIYIAAGAGGETARHEMLHSILQDPSHDHPLFADPWYNSPFSR